MSYHTVKLSTYSLPAQASLVSRVDIGIYYFTLRFPSDYELGLTNSDGTKDELISIAHNLARFINKHNSVMLSQEYHGHVDQIKSSSHLKQRINLKGKSSFEYVSENSILNDIDKIDQQDQLAHLKTLASFFRQATSRSPPLYVGVTRDQSFKTRLNQHLNGETGFAGRLVGLKISWSDLLFETLTTDIGRDINLRWAERIVQSIVQPPLSNA